MRKAGVDGGATTVVEGILGGYLGGWSNRSHHSLQNDAILERRQNTKQSIVSGPICELML